jgi:hypothetical protein
MKKITFLLVIALFSLNSFPQEKSTLKKSPIDFFTTVENYTKEFNRSNKDNLLKSKVYSDSEVLALAEEYYKAKADDPIGFHFYEKGKQKEFEENLSKKTVSKDELMFPEKVGLVYKIISSKYGRNFTETIGIPWYLKVNVLDIKQGKFKSSIGILGKTYLVARIEEVIKGEKFFKQGDTIEINYLANWLSDANKKFENNKSYFLGLREWDCYDGNCTEIALYVFPDKNDGIYPIENGYVIAPDNYFGIEDDLGWSKFKSEFIKKYILIGG